MRIHGVFQLQLACVAAFVLGASGCGGDGFCEIHGTVSFKNQPIEKGAIHFVPVDGNAPTAATLIKGGKYSTKVMPGKKQVRIEAFKVLGQRHLHANDKTSPMVDIQEQTLPERYNAKTELVREIPAGGVDFNLE